MKLAHLHEAQLDESWATVALDLVGLIPGAEPADLAAAGLHIKDGEYFSAAMSILSVVPGVGDAIGKAAKYLGKNSATVAKFITRYGDDVVKYWPKAKQAISKSEKLRPYAAYLDGAVKEVLGQRKPQRSQTVANHMAAAKPMPGRL